METDIFSTTSVDHSTFGQSPFDSMTFDQNKVVMQEDNSFEFLFHSLCVAANAVMVDLPKIKVGIL